MLNNFFWLLLDKIIKLCTGLFLGVWIARYLEPDNYGIYSYAFTITGIIGILGDLGVQNIAIREIVKKPEEKSYILGSALFIKAIGSVIAYISLIICITLLRGNEINVVLIVLILGTRIFWKIGEDIAIVWFESLVKSKYIVIGQNLVSLAFITIKVFMLLNNYSLKDFVIVTTIESFLISLVLLILLHLKGVPVNSLKLRINYVKRILKAGLPLLFSNLFIVIYMGVDQIMLAYISGNYEVGIYAAAVKLSEVWYFLPIIISSTIFPLIIQLKSNESELYLTRFQVLFDIMVILALILAVPISLFSGKIIEVLFGAEYSESSTILSLHIWAGVFVFLGVASDKWILAENKQILSFQRSIIGVLVNLILNYYLIPIYAGVGAAIATIISYSISAFFIDIIQDSTRPIFIMKLRSFHLYKSYMRLRDFFSTSVISNLVSNDASTN